RGREWGRVGGRRWGGKGGVKCKRGGDPSREDAQFFRQVDIAFSTPCIQHVLRTLDDDWQADRNAPGIETGPQHSAPRLPSRPFERGEAVAPMAAIGVFDEFRLAQARLALKEELAHLGGTIDQNTRRASKIESDDISVALGERCQEPEDVRSPKFVIESAELLTLRPGRRCRHQVPPPTALRIRAGAWRRCCQAACSPPTCASSQVTGRGSFAAPWSRLKPARISGLQSLKPGPCLFD